MEHVAGYTIVNDVTTRDLVFREDMKEIGTDWYRGKNAPGFLPTGPFLVPAPFVATPGDLHLELTLNGETMQDATTSDLLFDLPALIAGASQNMPLLPGRPAPHGQPRRQRHRARPDAARRRRDGRRDRGARRADRAGRRRGGAR